MSRSEHLAANGGFNVVRKSYEKWGSESVSTIAMDFGECLYTTEAMDLA